MKLSPVLKPIGYAALLSFMLLQGMRTVSSAEKSGQSDHTITFPEELNTPYSFDAPPCKTFTVEQKQQQITDGERILSEILAAEKAGKDEYVIPTGDYRFPQKPHLGCKMGTSAFYLSDIKRPDDRPFSIVGNGVTFWSPPNENGRGSAIYLHQCDNILIVGITVDSDIPNDIEGKLTAVDKERNRIEIELLPGTITDEQKIFKSEGVDRRIVPFKANGRHIGELYSVDGSWGPGFTFLSGIERSDKEKRYWLSFEKRGMVDVIDDPKWEEVFGDKGTWKTGDGVALLYGAGGAFCLHDCKQIIMKDLSSHIAKFAIWEWGGFGSHRWINVKMIRRPRTNQLLGSDGCMFAAMKHGSLYDGLVIGETTDDAVNLHGYMGFVKNINPDGNVLTVDRRPEMFLPGDDLLFYDKQTGEVLGNTTAKTIAGNSIEIEGTLPANMDRVIVRYPQYECANWTIRNCVFSGSYQRILIQTGPGIFENNICRDLGNAMQLMVNFAGYEGGGLSGVVVRNNVFIDCGTSPNHRCIHAGFWANAARPVMLEHIEISNNLIVNAGSNAIEVSEADGLLVTNNILINPLRSTFLLQPEQITCRQAVCVANSRRVVASGNYLVERCAVTAEDAVSGSKFMNSAADPELAENTCVLDPENDIHTYVYKLLDEGRKQLDVHGLQEKTRELIRTHASSGESVGEVGLR